MTNVEKKWVIANWKMQPLQQNIAKELTQVLVEKISNSQQSLPNIMLAPSFLHMSAVSEILQQIETMLLLASQDVCGFSATQGAFTGEVSASQLTDLHTSAVIVGHSERRQYFAEDNHILAKKISCALEQNLTIILCVGETAEQYENNQTKTVIAEQLSVLHAFIEKSLNPSQLIVAYEPVWAIGTGKVPTVEEVTNVHEFIKQQLSSYQVDFVKVPVIYGGSVKAENAQDFAKSPLISGVLVGGASLDADSFWQIINAFCE